MIRLTRRVRVSSFDAQATVSLGRDRPEFLAVARLAADLGRPIGPRDVLRELLGARPEILGLRVIERCVALGLLERVGRGAEAALTGAGRLALEHSEVLVPEEGAWRFFVIDDPLVPAALVHVQRLGTEPAKKEREAAKQARSRGERRPQMEGSPELLRRCCAAAPRQSVQNGHLFQLVELAERGAAGPSGELRLMVGWDSAPAIRLSGRLPLDGDGGGEKTFEAELAIPPRLEQLSRDALWATLVGHARGVPGHELARWRAVAGRPVVPVPFSSLEEAGRRTFRLDINVPETDLAGLGAFEPTALKDVEIVPSSEVDAQAWLAWLQWNVVNEYVTPRKLEESGREQRVRFPYHAPRMLSAAELLAHARAHRDERSWFLLAPFDLGLWS